MKDAAKISDNRTQIKTIFQYLCKRVATASMVAEATGIPHKNICRYKRDLQKSGKLIEVRKGICQQTKHRAWYITCDPAHTNQMKLL